jgi:hypothetical protein
LIIKRHNGLNELIISFILSIFIFFLLFEEKNITVVVENFKEKILTYDIGLSRLRNISNKEDSAIKKTFSVIKRTPYIIYKNITGFERSKVENLNITIKFLDYKVILSDRDRAIKNQILRNPNEVNATINFRGKSYKAKVRLKGDLKDHWISTHRMSLRVDLKGNNTIFGLNQFNIQKPSTRLFPYDLVFQDLVRSIGNLSTEHQIIKVSINGQEWGLMDLESHVGKEFIERNQKKESIIVRFSNEDGWYYKWKYFGKNYAPSFYRLSDPILFSKVYGEGKKFSNFNRKRFSYIVDERIKRSDTLYDVDTYTKLLLLAKLWGDMHVLYENNVKHYFNPYTLRLEPVSSDQYEPRNLMYSDDPFNLIGKCPNDYSFTISEIYQRIKNTEKYKNNLVKNYKTVADLNSRAERLFHQYHQYFPLENFPYTNFLDKNKSFAEKMGDEFFEIKDECEGTMDPETKYNWKEKKYDVIDHVSALHYNDGNIKIFNLIPDQIKLLAIKDKSGNKFVINETIPEYNKNTYTYHSYQTNFKGIYDDNLEIITEYNGVIHASKLYKTIIPNVNNPLLDTKIIDSPFLQKINENNFLVKKGEWDIAKPIIINGNLEISPGTKLNFNESSYLIVNGKLIAKGINTNKIVLTSSEESWMGIYVFEAKETSILENIVIEKTSSINHGLLQITGGITFYKSDVMIKDAILRGSIAEDSLNIIESNYLIENSIIMSSLSDAFDSDFSVGEINNLSLNDIMGDGIDSSGSNITITNLKASNIFDKAISGGEKSYINIDGCIIDNIGVGIVAKDESFINSLDCLITNPKMASLMSYVKKNFYGSPILNYTSQPNQGNDLLSIRQNGTSLTVNGVSIDPTDLNVENLYKSSFMKK